MSLVKITNKLPKLNGKLFQLQVIVPPEPVYTPYTIRLKFKDGVTPTMPVGTFTQVSSSPNVWDYTYNDNDWSGLFSHNDDLIEVLGGNTSGITNMSSLFGYCSSLTSVALFDTSSVTDMSFMFTECPITTIPQFNTSNVEDMSCMLKDCGSLTSIPLLNTSNVTDMDYMFDYCSSLTSVPLFDTSKVTTTHGMFRRCEELTTIPLFDTSSMDNVDAMLIDCFNVESGALALYNQMSSQANPPSTHFMTFEGCGRDTQTGAAELAQIPLDWGGQM